MKYSKTETIPLEWKNDTLPVAVTSKIHDDMALVFDRIRISEGEMSGTVIFNIKKSADNTFYYTKQLESRGKRTKDAESNIQKINYDIRVSDSSLYFPDAFYFPKNLPYRAQNIKIDIYVPEGKYIRVSTDENANYWIDADFADNDPCDNELINHTYQMTSSGLKCIDQKQEQEKETDDEDQ